MRTRQRIAKSIDRVLVVTGDVTAMRVALTRFFGSTTAIGDLPLDLEEGAGSSRFAGIGLECERVDDAVHELDARGIEHGDVARGRVLLPGLVGKGTEVWVCEPARDRRAHAVVPGGLDVRAVAEVVVGVADPDDALHRWQALLHPRRPAERGLWPVGDGPALRVVPHRRDVVLGLKLCVAALSAARSFLEATGMPGVITGDGIEVDARLLLGLDVLLVD